MDTDSERMSKAINSSLALPTRACETPVSGCAYIYQSSDTGVPIRPHPLYAKTSDQRLPLWEPIRIKKVLGGLVVKHLSVPQVQVPPPTSYGGFFTRIFSWNFPSQ